MRTFGVSTIDIVDVNFFGEGSIELAPTVLTELQAGDEFLIIQPACGEARLTITIATVVMRGDECYYALRFANDSYGIYKLTEKGELELLHSITKKQPRTLNGAKFYEIDASCING